MLQSLDGLPSPSHGYCVASAAPVGVCTADILHHAFQQHADGHDIPLRMLIKYHQAFEPVDEAFHPSALQLQVALLALHFFGPMFSVIILCHAFLPALRLFRTVLHALVRVVVYLAWSFIRFPFVLVKLFFLKAHLIAYSLIFLTLCMACSADRGAIAFMMYTGNRVALPTRTLPFGIDFVRHNSEMLAYAEKFGYMLLDTLTSRYGTRLAHDVLRRTPVQVLLVYSGAVVKLAAPCWRPVFKQFQYWIGKVDELLLWLKEPAHIAALLALAIIFFSLLVLTYGIFRLGCIITVRVMRRVAYARSVAPVVILSKGLTEGGGIPGDTEELRSTSTLQEIQPAADVPSLVATLSVSLGSVDESTALSMDYSQLEEMDSEDSEDQEFLDAFEYPPLPGDNEDDFAEDRTLQDGAAVIGLGPFKAVDETEDHEEHGQECSTAGSSVFSQGICAGSVESALDISSSIDASCRTLDTFALDSEDIPSPNTAMDLDPAMIPLPMDDDFFGFDCEESPQPSSPTLPACAAQVVVAAPAPVLEVSENIAEAQFATEVEEVDASMVPLPEDHDDWIDDDAFSSSEDSIRTEEPSIGNETAGSVLSMGLEQPTIASPPMDDSDEAHLATEVEVDASMVPLPEDDDDWIDDRTSSSSEDSIRIEEPTIGNETSGSVLSVRLEPPTIASPPMDNNDEVDELDPATVPLPDDDDDDLLELEVAAEERGEWWVLAEELSQQASVLLSPPTPSVEELDAITEGEIDRSFDLSLDIFDKEATTSERLGPRVVRSSDSQPLQPPHSPAPQQTEELPVSPCQVPLLSPSEDEDLSCRDHVEAALPPPPPEVEVKEETAGPSRSASEAGAVTPPASAARRARITFGAFGLVARASADAAASVRRPAASEKPCSGPPSTNSGKTDVHEKTLEPTPLGSTAGPSTSVANPALGSKRVSGGRYSHVRRFTGKRKEKK